MRLMGQQRLITRTSTAVLCSTITSLQMLTTVPKTTTFVTFSGAVTLGDVITADVLNQEYQVSHVVDVQTPIYVEAREVATLNAITTSTGYTPTYVFATVKRHR